MGRGLLLSGLLGFDLQSISLCCAGYPELTTSLLLKPSIYGCVYGEAFILRNYCKLVGHNLFWLLLLMIFTHTIVVQAQYLHKSIQISCFVPSFSCKVCVEMACMAFRYLWICAFLITFVFSFHAEFSVSLLLICNSNCPFGSVSDSLNSNIFSSFPRQQRSAAGQNDS